MGCLSSNPLRILTDGAAPPHLSLTMGVLPQGGSQAQLTSMPPKMHLRELLVHEHHGVNPWKESFEKVRLLGAGISGSVFLVRNKKTGSTHAMKTLHMEKLAAERLSDFRNEVELLRTLDHPNVIKLIEYFETSDGKIFLILEALSGGELYDRLNMQPEGRFREADAVNLMVQMANAVAYMHSEGIVHRDLKLENFLFRDKTGMDLKIIDLGLSHRYSNGVHLKSVVGTPYYIAPEVLKMAQEGDSSGYSEKIDSWSLGVLAYMLLTGTPPFKGRRDNEVIEAVRRGKFNLSGAKWDNVSKDAKDFIRKLLVYNPDQRMCVRDALQHPWLLTARKAATEQTKLNADVVSGLRRYSHLHGWKRAVLEAVAFTSSDDGELSDLRTSFQKCDVHGTGHVDLGDFTATLADVGISSEEAARLFRACTTEERKTIAYTEWLAATIPRRFLTRKVLREAFDALDVDGAGYLTQAGMIKVLGSEFDNIHLDDLFGPGGETKKRLGFDHFYDQFFLRAASEDQEEM